MKISSKPKGFRFQLHLVALLLLIVFASYFIYGNLITLANVAAEKARVEAKIESAEKEEQDLINQEAERDSDIYIEKIAREYLGLVKPDEIIFIKK